MHYCVLLHITLVYSIHVKCRETHMHFSMWEGVVHRTQNFGGGVRHTQSWGGYSLSHPKGGDPLAAEGRANLGTPSPLGMFWHLP